MANAYLGPGQHHDVVGESSGSAELDTEAKLVGGSATALDCVQVRTRQAEVLAQDRRFDLGRKSLGGVDLIQRLLLGLRLPLGPLRHWLSPASSPNSTCASTARAQRGRTPPRAW